MYSLCESGGENSTKLFFFVENKSCTIFSKEGTMVIHRDYYGRSSQVSETDREMNLKQLNDRSFMPMNR